MGWIPGDEGASRSGRASALVADKKRMDPERARKWTLRAVPYTQRLKTFLS